MRYREVTGEANTELNNLRKIICFRKTKVSVERVFVYKVIENWWSMANVSVMLPHSFNDFILSAMLLHQ